MQSHAIYIIMRSSLLSTSPRLRTQSLLRNDSLCRNRRIPGLARIALQAAARLISAC